MSPEMQALVAEIKQIQLTLDQAHDVDMDYLPPLVRDLRNYIFQVHASYEQSLQLLIIQHYFVQGRPYDEYLQVLENITFEGKLKIVSLYEPAFPLRSAKKLNFIRNDFAHKNGMQLRQAFDDRDRLKVYKYLMKCHERHWDFWRQRRETAA